MLAWYGGTHHERYSHSVEERYGMHQEKVKEGSRALEDARALCASAFPPEEQLPFEMLVTLATRSEVNFIAYYDHDTFCGITFSAATENLLYLGYLATCANLRSQGYGSRILQEIERSAEGKTIVLEIESLDLVEASNYAQRQRRKAFYERNGFRDSGLRELDGGTRYDVMIKGNDLSKEDLRGLHEKVWEGKHFVEVL